MPTYPSTSPALLAYIECAICIWEATRDNDVSLDENYSPEDIHPDSIAVMRADLEDFVTANADLIKESGLDDTQVSHDFWLTRNGHGTGFWDRGLGKVGDKLADAARVYGSQSLYVGDDGWLYAG